MLPSAAIAAFAESLVEGRRVLLLGSSGHNLWQKILDRGARLVHVCDPDPVRLSEAAARNTSPNASFAPLSSQAALALRDSVFDLGIVDNLAAFDDPSEILRILRRALSPRGVAFITAPNPDVRESLLPDATPIRKALDYYSLYDVVRAEFPVVRMLGQMPFVGYTMAELSPLDDPEPTIDAGFVPGGTEEPEWFVAAASAHPIDINSFTIVQVPVADVLHHSTERQLREQLRASRTAERSAVERLARLEGQQLDLTARVAEAKENAEASRQVSQLRIDAQRRDERIIALEAQVVGAEVRQAEAQRQLEQSRQALAHAEQGETKRAELIKRLTEVSEHASARAERAEAEHAALMARLTQTSEQATTAEQQAADATQDVERLEVQLRERGVRLRQLESDLKAAERVGQQLIRDLEAARQGKDRRFGSEAWAISSAGLPPEPLATDTAQSSGASSAWVSSQVDGSASSEVVAVSADVERMAADNARLQADLIAATWRIDQMLSLIERNDASDGRLTKAKAQLSDAEARLNEQAALLSQLESRT